jgi:hypothetical protein
LSYQGKERKREAMTETYKVNGETKYWATRASAVRVSSKLYAEDQNTVWVEACDDNGWFLENLDTVETPVR